MADDRLGGAGVHLLVSPGCYNAVVVDEELTRRVQALRAEGKSPKQIARALRVPPARVAPVVRAIAEQAASSAATKAAVVGCWVSAGWGVGLVVKDGHGWPDLPGHGMTASGLVGVVVAREGARGRGVSVCGYLVDTYCLGVKDAVGPLVMTPRELRRFVELFFVPFDGARADRARSRACVGRR